jgi:hypothetical protein
MSVEYTFRITGKLTSPLMNALRPLEVTATATETLLVGKVTDRAELHGLIARIEALGLDLVELHRLSRRPGHRGEDYLSPSGRTDRAPDAPTAPASRSRT